VTLVHRRDTLRAEKILQDRLMKHLKIEVLWNYVLEEVVGSENPTSVTGARLKSTKDNSQKLIDVDGIFIAIGHSPNTGLFVNQLKLDEEGYIITKPGSTVTNIEGVYAAGDVQDKIFRQAITAAGTGCMAALEVEKFLASTL
jgi:thioredoxin reductase (NADPH)